MRAFGPILFLALTSCSAPPTPSLAEKLDSRVVMPKGAKTLNSYDRFYAKDGTGWIGVFDSTIENGGRATLVEPDDLPLVLDGGCDIVNVRFDKNQKFVAAFCNGEA